MSGFMKLLTPLALVLFLVACGEDEAKNEVGAADTEDATTTEETSEVSAEPVEEEVVEETPVQKALTQIVGLINEGKAFDVGSYIAGDIPTGTYAFIPLSLEGGYYVEKDAADKIIDNEIFDAFGYVHVHGLGNIETNGVLITEADLQTLGFTSAKSLFELLNNQTDYTAAGYYKVGVDLPAGTYVATSTGGDGYVAVMTGPVGNSKIVNNEIFNGRYQVTVTDGQYLKVSDATIGQ